jgi:hypothetical protein
MKRSLLLCSLLFCLGASPVRALDPEVSKPYHLKVVLRIADHRLLKGIFSDQVPRELQDSLQAALGRLTRVEVVTDHPKLKEIEEKGLQQALDAWKDVSETKTHFVFIDFVDGQYEIQLRQHDGLTGQASATVRRERLEDRQFVARRVGQLIGEDFGPVGTITDKGIPAERTAGTITKVQMALKGSSLGTPLGTWVKPGDVFAVVQISQGGGALHAYRVPWALLQVKDELKDGVTTCRLYHRHPRPLDGGAGVAGYRCLKLSTRTAQPLRLQLVSYSAKRPVPERDKQVHVQHYGFDPEPKSWVPGNTNNQGFMTTEGKKDGLFDHVAFVVILVGEDAKANIPVPLVDDRPVVIPVALASDAATQVTDIKNNWTHRIYESVQAVAGLLKEIGELVGKADQRETARDRAKAGLKVVQDDLEHFTAMQKQLETEASQAGVKDLNLNDGKRGLAELKKGQAILAQYAEKLDKLVKQKDSAEHKELEAKVTQAQLAENDADYDRALGLYGDVIKANRADADLQSYVDKLKAAWKIRDDAHRQAREFIYKEWPNVDPVRMLPELPKLKKAFEKCREVGDNLSPRKILTVAVTHIGKLQEVAKSLHPEEKDDDRNTAQTLDEVKTQLTELLTAVNNYVNQGAK